MNYEEYKDRYKNKSQGLGDDIAKVTKSLGVDILANKVAKSLGFNSCGCEERKDTLNKMFDYKNPECLTEEEYDYLKYWFSLDLRRPNIEETMDRNNLFDIHNRVFKTEKPYTNCGVCITEIVENLRKLIKAYE